MFMGHHPHETFPIRVYLHLAPHGGILCSVMCMFVGKLNADRAKGVVDHIICLQELIQRLQKLRMDNVEYAYLRALVLFSTGMSSIDQYPVIDNIL